MVGVRAEALRSGRCDVAVGSPIPSEPPDLAVGETVILLPPPLPLVGVSMVMERGCQQNDSLADGEPDQCRAERINRRPIVWDACAAPRFHDMDHEDAGSGAGGTPLRVSVAPSR